MATTPPRQQFGQFMLDVLRFPIVVSAWASADAGEKERENRRF
jgi:hypothetical protein